MTTHNASDFESPELTRLLKIMEHDAVAPDAQLLASIRETTRAAFLAAQCEKPADASHSVTHRTNASGPKQPPMGSRWMAILSMMASLMFAIWLLSPNVVQADPTLGELLRAVRDASSLSVVVHTPEGVSNVSFQAPGVVRWDDANGSYRIADGSRLWKVDATKGIVGEEASPLPAEGMDGLSLLQLAELAPDKFRNTHPLRHEVIDGVPSLVYEAHVTLNQKAATLKAIARKDSRQLTSLQLVSDENSTVLADVQLVAMNAAVAKEAFQLPKSLQQKGSVGTLSDIQGIVYVRSFPGHRWTPASESLSLFPGDQIRCETRGANAAVIRLTSGGQVTMGPSTLVSLTSASRVQLLKGEVEAKGPNAEVDVTARQPEVLEVAGSDGSVRRVNEAVILKVVTEPASVVVLETEPAWLKSLRGTLTAESLGSLVAKVDGRDVSLTMGFHHVTVEVRDQIARTTIEESFVNNTDGRLEGQFHFPLPHDASISGFGMWIGNELVEADVVEKQRAREIYETILRENRDPGLLEWEGGNIFKARVFPIEAHSEKRIRITYTQTLPLQNGVFRYHYPLRSELLQKTPLKHLSIDVLVHSKVPLASLACPSHSVMTDAAKEQVAVPTSGIRQLGPVTIEQTRFSGRLHYEASDITPQRDFELLCTMDGRQSDVVFVPHVRGSDGYFLLQLAPPAVSDGNWSRMMVRDGKPLDVLVVCDTSRSMDKVARKQQHDLVAALLGSLAESDRVRVACVDTGCDWILKDALTVNEETRSKILKRLDDRRSLGWSNLSVGFDEIFRAASPETQVVYIGDGTVVTQDSQAGAMFASWLNRVSKTQKVPTCHSIAVGNAYDMTVLSAIGRMGRGTTRVASMSDAASDVVRELLLEVTRPGLRDLKVEFQGLEVAAVYPAVLPNLPDGMQHMLTGRFRPSSSGVMTGEVIITGLRGDEPVKYVARVSSGNEVPAQPADETVAATDAQTNDDASFIPRLWAKQHIDHLLQEAATPEIQQRIIALSKEFHLMTPYTSLLVLETDEDRRRFGVERSMQMRDGEQFFADGRKEAEYSLRQQQLQIARLWRQQLFRSISAQIGQYGREEFLASQQVSTPNYSFYVPFNRGPASGGRPGATSYGRAPTGGVDLYFAKPGASAQHWAFDVDNDGDGLRRSMWFDTSGAPSDELSEFVVEQEVLNSYTESLSRWSTLGRTMNRFGTVEQRLEEVQLLPAIASPEGYLHLPTTGLGFEVQGRYDSDFAGRVRPNELRAKARNMAVSEEYFFNSDYTDSYAWSDTTRGYRFRGVNPATPSLPDIRVEPPVFGLSDVLPTIPEVVSNEVVFPGNARELFLDPIHRQKRYTPDAKYWDTCEWPEDVRSILRELEKDDTDFRDGVDLTFELTEQHPTRGTRTQLSATHVLWHTETGWILDMAGDNGQFRHWSVGDYSGSIRTATRTGLIAKLPQAVERCAIPMSFRDQIGLRRASEWDAKVDSSTDTQTVILLTYRDQPWVQYRWTIDRERNCLLRNETLLDGIVRSQTIFSDHVQVENRWRATRILDEQWEELSKSLRTVNEARLTIKIVPGEDAKTLVTQLATQRMEGWSASGGIGNSRTLLLPASLPGLLESRQAVISGTATPQQKIVRVFELANQAQWDDALSLLEATLKETQQTEAGRFLRTSLLEAARRFEVLRKEIEQTEPASLLTGISGVLSEESVSSPSSMEFQKSAFSQWTIFRHLTQILRDHATATMDERQLEQALNQLIASTQTFESTNSAAVGNTFLLTLLGQKRDLLESHHRTAEVMELQQQIRTRWPWNLDELSRQVRLLQAQRRAADVRALYEAELSPEKAWTRAELDAMFDSYLAWLRRRGEFDAGLKLCDRWTARCPINSSAWQHRLRSLIETNQKDVVLGDLEQWLKEAHLPQAGDNPALLNQPVDPAIEARRDAALDFGRGSVAGLQLRGPQRVTYDSLATLAASYSRSDRHLDIAKRVLDDSVIASRPASREVVKTHVRWLTETASTASLAQLTATMTWLQQAGLHDCPEHQQLLVSLRKVLTDELAAMSLNRARVILMDVRVCSDPRTTKEERQAWLDVLIQRWQKETSLTVRSELSQLIQQVIDIGFEAPRSLEWHRQQFREAREDERTAAASRLFETLLGQTWSDAIEEEAWLLLPVLSAGEPDKIEARAAATLPPLQRWIETMVSQRAAHHQKNYPGFDDLDAKRKQHVGKECRVKALREMITVLARKQEQAANAVAPAGAGSDPAAAAQLIPPAVFRFRRLHQLMLKCELSEYEVTFGVSDDERATLRHAIIDECQKLCGPEPLPTPDPAVKPANEEEAHKRWFDLVERHTAFAMWLMMTIQLDDPAVNLSAAGSRTNAADSATPEDKPLPARCQKLLDYVRRGQETDPVAPDAWRAAEFGLLIAFDRPKMLEERLRIWLTAEETKKGEKNAAGNSRRNLSGLWRIQLGNVLAELDRLEDAVALYEAAGASDELNAAEWQQLSVWQHALDRRQNMQNSLRQSWKHQTSDQLLAELNQALNTWQNSPETRTPQASEDVRFRLEILLQGTSQLDSAIRLVAQWYKATHDPLVMDSMAPFVTGRSRAHLFDVLEYSQSAINDIDQEAGFDALLRSIGKEKARIREKAVVRDGDEEQKRLDLMGLTVLELQASASATRITNQPEPHERAVVAAFNELAKFEWSDSERQRIAVRFHNLTLKSKAVEAARWSALERLLLQEKSGTKGRLSIATLMARLVERSEPEKSGTLAETEIRTALNAGDHESAELLGLIQFQIQHLIGQKRFSAAETLLMETTRDVFLNDRAGLLFQIQLAALENKGRVSLSENETLYQALHDEMLKAVLDPERADEFSTDLGRYFRVLEMAHWRGFKQAEEDARAFAAKHADALLLRRSDEEDRLISECLGALRLSKQTKEQIEFLLRQLEAEPLALQWTRPTARWTNWFDDLIAASFDRLAVVNARAMLVRKPEAGAYQQRLNAVMKKGLESVLTLAMEEDQGVPLDMTWYLENAVPAAEVETVVRQVAATVSDSSGDFGNLASWAEVAMENRALALEVLLVGNARSDLQFPQLDRLVSLLVEKSRLPEAQHLAGKLTDRCPMEQSSRQRLLQLLHLMGLTDKVTEQIALIRKELVPDDSSWDKLWSLAAVASECRQWQTSLELYDLGIKAHGVPVLVTPPYAVAQQGRATCLSELGKTPEALEALSIAWATCGQDQNLRSSIQATLQSVMTAAADLKSIIALLDRKAAENGDDSSFLRRALGKALLDREMSGDAETQLRIALQLQSQDSEAWTWLLSSLDKQLKQQAAIDALLDHSDVNRRDTGLYRELYRRWKTLNDSLAEQAATSVIEVAPEEADHHSVLAEIRFNEGHLAACLAHRQRAADLRKEDPTLLVHLAEAQIRFGDRIAARGTLNRLATTKWDERFVDIPNEIRHLRQQLR
ncbi:MAG: VIT and VWA domain-containing protein [Planctomycetaceae bacterium]